MTAKLLDAVDAVVTLLNASTFSQSFTATDSVMPEFTLADLDALTVTVVAKSEDLTNRDRSSTQRDHGIDVGVMKRLPKYVNATTDRATVRGLIALCEEIQNALLRASFGTSRCVGVTNAPIYDTALLREKRLFMSAITATLREVS